jgi:O-antigen ligase
MMKNKKSKIKPPTWDNWPAKLICLALTCLWGGIYDFSYAIYGAVFGGALLLVSAKLKEKKIRLPKGVTTYCLGLLVVCYVIAAFAARDKGVAAMGIVHPVALFMFWILWNNLEDDLKKGIFGFIPDMAAVLTLLAYIMYFIPGAGEYLYQAQRLGGIFQYSNTYALFLLTAVVIRIYDEKTVRSFVEIVILLSGIVFCGSRSVILITVVFLAIFFIQNIQNIKSGKMIIWLIAVLAGVCTLLQLVMKLDIQRLLKITLSSSTLNGRLLYWQDAIKVIAKKPFGLGYMGYYFMQPQFQTGNYVTKFVHNDILQFALDGGWLAMICIVVIFVSNIIKQDGCRRSILILIFVHSLFDFDLQYAAVMCVAVMCMSCDECQEADKSLVNSVAGILTIGCVYLAVAFAFDRFGAYETAVKLYPGNTFARMELMQDDPDEAEKVIEKNGMSADAYEYAVEKHLADADYQAAFEDIEGMLDVAGYRISCYNQAVYDMSYVLYQALAAEDYDELARVLDEIANVPVRLEDLKSRTSELAYRINDKPDFELEPEIQEYIDSLADASVE